jgi:hypothetical protein
MKINVLDEINEPNLIAYYNTVTDEFSFSHYNKVLDDNFIRNRNWYCSGVYSFRIEPCSNYNELFSLFLLVCFKKISKFFIDDEEIELNNFLKTNIEKSLKKDTFTLYYTPVEPRERVKALSYIQLDDDNEILDVTSFDNYSKYNIKSISNAADLFKGGLKINLIFDKLPPDTDMMSTVAGFCYYRTKNIVDFNLRKALLYKETVRLIFSNEDRATIKEALNNPMGYIYENNIPVYYLTLKECAPYTLFNKKFNNKDSTLRASKTVAIVKTNTLPQYITKYFTDREKYSFKKFSFNNLKRFLFKENIILEEKPVDLTKFMIPLDTKIKCQSEDELMDKINTKIKYFLPPSYLHSTALKDIAERFPFLYSHLSEKCIILKPCCEHEQLKVHKILERKACMLSADGFKIEFFSYFINLKLSKLFKRTFKDKYYTAFEFLINYRIYPTERKEILLPQMKKYLKEKNPKYDATLIKQIIRFLSLPDDLLVSIYNCYDYLEIDKFNTKDPTKDNTLMYDEIWQDLITLPD